MSKQEVFIPLLNWLIGGSRIGGSYNIYCGSLGTDPQKGCYGQQIANYRVWIEKLEEAEIIKASVYYGMNSYENQNPDEIYTEIFELSEESRPLIKSWIESKINN